MSVPVLAGDADYGAVSNLTRCQSFPLRTLRLAVGPRWGLYIWQNLPMSLESIENRFPRTLIAVLSMEKNTAVRVYPCRNLVRKEL